MATAVLLGGFFFLAAVGVPLIVALAIPSVIVMVFFIDLPMIVASQSFADGIDNFVLISVPLFILMGELMNAGGISRRLLDLAAALVGHLVGGFAQVNVVLSVFIAGLSGASASDVAFDMKVLVPMMVRSGYGAPFSAAVTSMSAMIAPIIPPSIAMILYGSITGTSIGSLFLAGIVPGLLLAATLMLGVHRISRRRSYRSSIRRQSMRETMGRFRSAAWGILLPIVVIGGIRLGVFTPTEAGGVGVMASFFIGFLVHRELKPGDVWRVLSQAARDTGVVMVLLAAAAPFTFVIIADGLPQKIVDAVGSWGLGKTGFLLLVVGIILIAGAVIEATALLVMVTPILQPAVMTLGVDPVHFGIVLIVAIMVGTVTPPFGQSVFIASAMGGIPPESIFREIIWFLPWLVAMLLALILLPGVFLWIT